jgi:two-component system cell cycle response regulator
MGVAPSEGRELAWSGLAEAPAAFTPASPLAAPAPVARVALLCAGAAGAAPPAQSVARLLGAEVDRLRSAREVGVADGPAYDLVLIDGAGTRGDLQEGAAVLALLADLQGRQRPGPAATLVLLPGTALETAALALDLGASDVIAGPVGPSEVAIRAKALVARRRLREALRDQVRLGLRAAVTDPLTGLHNRRYAESALRRMAGGGTGGPSRGLALVMVDIDHFKPINDTHGHAAGDRVLVEVARRFRMALRPSDLLARVGGEEFLLALPDATAEEAGLVAERLRRSICQRPFVLDGESGGLRHGDASTPALGPSLPWDGLALPEVEARLPMVRVTVSLGVAAVPPQALDAGPGLAALIRRADAALYEAKSAGRNCVVLSSAA